MQIQRALLCLGVACLILSALQLSKQPVPVGLESWVAVRLVQRRGNQLFQLASSYGIAKARGARWCVMNPEDSLLRNLVAMHHRPALCPSYTYFERVSERGRFEHYVPEILSAPGNIEVGDYLQSWRYFQGLPFSLLHAEWARGWVASRKVEVGIHVRRGDLLERPANTMYNVAPAEYFANAIERLRALTQRQDLRFVVCTDDAAWVRAQPVFEGMLVTEGTTPDQDLSILAACKHIITSVGTFGWWAAYMKQDREGHVFYYDQPFKSNHEMGHNPADHFPPTWMPIGAVARPMCPFTVVTAYFDVPSKSPKSFYSAQLLAFFALHPCAVVFTDDEAMFAPYASPTVRVVLRSLPEEAERLNRTEQFWQAQLEADQERSIHRSYELYWIWALKTLFVADAAQMDVFGTEWFFWLDAGGVRQNFPGRQFQPITLDPESVYYACVKPFTLEELQHNSNVKFEMKVHLAGGLFLVHRSRAERWSKTYLRVFDQYTERGWFLGKDQDLLATACVQYPSECALLPTNTAPGNPWFSVLYYALGMMPDATPYHLSCELKVMHDLPRDSTGAMQAHHWDARSPKWNEEDRWHPLPEPVQGVVLYVGGNTEGADGVHLKKEYPQIELHVYEPVPVFCAHLRTHYMHLGIEAQVHCVGLGMGNHTFRVDAADIKGQSTYIMNSHASKGVDAVVVDAASEVGRWPEVQLLHMNCEGCEWDFFDSCADVLRRVRVIQFSLHYLPLDRDPAVVSQQYCQLRDLLSQTHTQAFGVPFGWERWVRKP